MRRGVQPQVPVPFSPDTQRSPASIPRQRLTDVEKLARRICWLEFVRPRRDTTEREYWVGVHPDKKLEYIQDAEWLVWMLNRLNAKVDSQNLLWNLRRARAALAGDARPADTRPEGTPNSPTA